MKSQFSTASVVLLALILPFGTSTSLRNMVVLGSDKKEREDLTTNVFFQVRFSILFSVVIC
jgi:hypothetical protein